MAIKKRPPVDPATKAAQIEAFAAAAEDTTTGPAVTAATPQESAPVTKPPKAAAGKAKPKPKPMLLRLDAEQHELLKQVADQQQRSMHNMALTVLIPALAALRDNERG